MARRRSSTSIVRVAPAPYRAPAPVIRIAAPRAVAPKKKHHRRRSSASGGSLNSHLMSTVMAAAAVGFIEGTDIGKSLPALPFLGKKGTIALAAYFWSKNGGPRITRDVALLAAGLAAYQLVKDGKIDGGDDF